MSEQLHTLSDGDLRLLAGALRSGRLSAPFNSLGIRRILDERTAAPAAASLQAWADQGFSEQQIATLLELLVSDRRLRPQLVEHLDLVTTGPDIHGATHRDTGVVVRELFGGAASSVLIAGFAIYQGQQVFQVLADRMQERPELKVRIFAEVHRPIGDTTISSELVRRFAAQFRTRQWPADRPLPSLFYDPRSLEMGADKRSSMHAKCIIVDGRAVFISSANFTEAAQERNIEVGALIHSISIAERLTRFFDSLLNEGMFLSVL